MATAIGIDPAEFMSAAPKLLNGNTPWAAWVLPSRHVVYIDAADLPLVRRFKWHALRAKRTVYVQTHGSADGDQPRNYLHRILLNAGPGQLVDHANGSGLDNRRSNLRLCSPGLNVVNSKLSVRNTTGYRGVVRYKGRFRARIGRQGTPSFMHLGYFDDAWEAAEAYNAAALTRYGEFARLNVRLNDDNNP